MSSTLPDLSQDTNVPVIKPNEQDLDALLTAAVGEKEITEEETEAIIKRAGDFEKKLLEGQKTKDKGGDKVEIKPPTTPEQETARQRAQRKAEEKAEEKKREKLGKGKGKGKAAQQARLAMALMGTSSAEKVVKPQEENPKKSKEGKDKDAKTDTGNTEGKEAKPSGKPGKAEATVNDPENPSPDKREEEDSETETEKGEKEKESDDALWASGPDDDASFPSVAAPESLQKYSELSIASSNMEGFAEDITALSRQNETILEMVKAINTRLAGIEGRLKKVETDKTHFASSLLDRVRETERAMGNKTPISTPSTSLTIPKPDAEPEQKRVPLSPEERKAKLAEWKAANKK